MNRRRVAAGPDGGRGGRGSPTARSVTIERAATLTSDASSHLRSDPACFAGNNGDSRTFVRPSPFSLPT
jgi:hypothetical protein